MGNETPTVSEQDPDLNKARPSRQTRLSPIWIVPIVAIIIVAGV